MPHLRTKEVKAKKRTPEKLLCNLYFRNRMPIHIFTRCIHKPCAVEWFYSFFYYCGKGFDCCVWRIFRRNDFHQIFIRIVNHFIDSQIVGIQKITRRVFFNLRVSWAIVAAKYSRLQATLSPTQSQPCKELKMPTPHVHTPPDWRIFISLLMETSAKNHHSTVRDKLSFWHPITYVSYHNSQVYHDN